MILLKLLEWQLYEQVLTDAFVQVNQEDRRKAVEA